jgi:acyl carrier protein
MKARVLEIVSNVLNVPVDRVSEDSSPDTIKEWDSLMHMNLVLTLEEEFGVHFSDEQIMEMLSVGQIIRTVLELVP